MTGPSMPFEARNGLFDHMGKFKEIHLPTAGADGRMIIQKISYKRFPAEASGQSFIEFAPSIRAWTKVDDIDSIVAELPFDGWQEIADPPKWDPRNRETADHSLPYIISRSLIDGDIYLDSFTEEKFMDPAARRLMDKITVRPNMDYTYLGRARITVRNKSGAEFVKETSVHVETPMTHDEVISKFKRACAFRSVSDGQRDRALTAWSNLRAVKDIAEPMRDLANFGRPLPL
jgi:2-methylcitrate dehydratase